MFACGPILDPTAQLEKDRMSVRVWFHAEEARLVELGADSEGGDLEGDDSEAVEKTKTSSAGSPES